jgi:hypothetical protein
MFDGSELNGITVGVWFMDTMKSVFVHNWNFL